MVFAIVQQYAPMRTGSYCTNEWFTGDVGIPSRWMGRTERLLTVMANEAAANTLLAIL